MTSLLNLLLKIPSVRKTKRPGLPKIGDDVYQRARKVFESGGGRVNTAQVADGMKYQVASANNMCNRLKRMGVISHAGYVESPSGAMSSWDWKHGDCSSCKKSRPSAMAYPKRVCEFTNTLVDFTDSCVQWVERSE